MHTAKLFINGKNQAVRIPKSLEFDGINEVEVYKEGSRLIIEPKRKTWLSFAKLNKADETFMSERPDLVDTQRVEF